MGVDFQGFTQIQSVKRNGRLPIDPADGGIDHQVFEGESGVWKCPCSECAEEPRNHGIKASDTTIDNVRKRNGIPAAPQRQKKVNWSRLIGGH